MVGDVHGCADELAELLEAHALSTKFIEHVRAPEPGPVDLV